MPNPLAQGIAVAKPRLANATFTDQVTRLIAGLILGDRFARKANNRQEVLSIIRGEICEGEFPAWCDAVSWDRDCWWNAWGRRGACTCMVRRGGWQLWHT